MFSFTWTTIRTVVIDCTDPFHIFYRYFIGRVRYSILIFMIGFRKYKSRKQCLSFSTSYYSTCTIVVSAISFFFILIRICLIPATTSNKTMRNSHVVGNVFTQTANLVTLTIVRISYNATIHIEQDTDCTCKCWLRMCVYKFTIHFLTFIFIY